MKLGVNVDHVATLRQQRKGLKPDPVEAALLCQAQSVDAIVMHLREDRRHIQDHDIRRAKKKLKIKFNMEMSIHPSVMAVALEVCPDQCTLVPEKRREMTTEGGLDLFQRPKVIEAAIKNLHKKGLSISLFLDPQSKQIKRAKDMGVKAIELHTGDYANATSSVLRNKHLKEIKDAAVMAHRLGLDVHVGHGLDYQNVAAMKRLPYLEEFNIGYSIICHSLEVGLAEAVRRMKNLVCE